MSIVFGLASFKNAVAGLHLQTVTYGCLLYTSPSPRD